MVAQPLTICNELVVKRNLRKIAYILFIVIASAAIGLAGGVPLSIVKEEETDIDKIELRDQENRHNLSA